MIDPSPAYKAAIQQNMRGSMGFRATVSIADPAFRDAATLTDNGHLPFSDIQNTKTAQVAEVVNVTAETNMYLLDGTRRLLPASPSYQGFVSQSVSNDQGEFTAPVVITISSGATLFDMAGLTIEFDTHHNDYPTDFTFTFYRNGVLIKTYPVTGNRKVEFVSEERADGINKLEITFLKTHNVNRRLRLLRILFGITQVFESEGRNGIISMSHKTRIHPLMTENVQMELTFLKADPDKTYDPENPLGIWKYMVAGQTLVWDYFFNISGAEREYVPGGIFYLKAAPATKNEDVQFQATGLLQTLTMIYTKGLYYAAGRTYYDLFTDIFTFANIPVDSAGLPVWKLDERLKNYRCYLPLPRKSVAQLVQLLCQNTGSIAREDTDGYLHITLNENVMSDNRLSLTTAHQYPGYDPQLPPLRSMSFNLYSVAVETATTELHKSSRVVTGTVTIPIQYAASTSQAATVTGGTLNSAQYFAYGCFLTVTASNATISITVTGKKLVISESQRVYNVNPQGADAEINQELLSDGTLCDALAVIYAKYLQETKRYKFNYLGDPARRANDLFPIETRFAESIPAQVIASEYSFNGGSKGVLELKNYDTE